MGTMDPMSVTRTTLTRHPEWLESLYERLAEDDEGRTCKEISAEACREAPGNCLHTLIANTLRSCSEFAM
jgi:hypothetical protein